MKESAHYRTLAVSHAGFARFWRKTLRRRRSAFSLERRAYNYGKSVHLAAEYAHKSRRAWEEEGWAKVAEQEAVT